MNSFNNVSNHIDAVTEILLGFSVMAVMAIGMVKIISLPIELFRNGEIIGGTCATIFAVFVLVCFGFFAYFGAKESRKVKMDEAAA